MANYRTLPFDQTEPKYVTPNTTAKGTPVVATREEGAIRVDEVSDTLFYVGYAINGTGEGTNSWKIKRIQKVGNVWSIGYPNGSSNYTFNWSGRAGYTYA